MSHFTLKDMTRGEFFSSASFAYSPTSFLADAAKSALLAEVWTTPKPGLVDRSNSGSHSDMDLAMFERSALALQESFQHCAEAGAALSKNIPALAAELRAIGLRAEAEMYEATGGINTHKGAIFSIGILCGAASMNFKSMDELQTNCRQIAALLLKEDTAVNTHGLAAQKTCGTGGIRKEALSGFDSAFSIGLPSIENALAAGCSENDALVYALLRIIAVTEDSNLAHRGGVSGIDFAKKEAERLTAEGPKAFDIEKVRKLDGEFIKRNLSPGGSADLLAFSAMLYFIKERQ
jgi:triphosphoribosyl-dephospho-CoA synthetase